MKIVFMGTPDFSVQALCALIDAGHEIVTVVTQPDKPKGRGRELSASPVKQCAKSRGLAVFQPARIREEEAVSHLKSLGADVFVVAAFGQILPKAVLDIPPMGCINIHASLLPKYRGAAPIQQAILEGEEETGITIMRMDEGCDTGDILWQERVSITKEETGGSLFDKLALLGAETIVKVLPMLEKGEITPVKQDPGISSLCGKLCKEAGRIDWSEDAKRIERRIRAVTPWPSATTALNGKSLRILSAKVADQEALSGLETEDKAPGTLLRADRTGLYLSTGDGVLVITSLQEAGKKPVSTGDYLNGHPLQEGSIFGA